MDDISTVEGVDIAIEAVEVLQTGDTLRIGVNALDRVNGTMPANAACAHRSLSPVHMSHAQSQPRSAFPEYVRGSSS